MGVRARLGAAAAILVVALSGAACSSGGDDEGASAGGADAAAVVQEASNDGGGGGSLHGTAYALNATSDLAQPAEGRDVYAASAVPERVIKTADLHLEVERDALGGVMREGRQIAEAAGGFLLSTSVDGTDRRSGEFVIRVPADAFEESLSALEKLGTVANENVRGEDVSQEFVDLEARLRNATAQEGVLFRLYDRSNSIADTIRVQRELEDVQLEIERLRGRLRFLADRTDLSTISVSVTETGVVSADAGPFAKAWEKAKDTFVAVISGVIVGAGFVLPLAGFGLLAYLLFRLVRPRLQRATP